MPGELKRKRVEIRNKNEVKWYDTAGAAFGRGQPLVTDWAQSELVSIPGNSTMTGRIGRRVTIKSVNCRYWVEKLATSDTNASDSITIMLIQDKQCNEAYPEYPDLFTDETKYDTQMNVVNEQRFIVLYRKVFDIRCGGGAQAGTEAFFANNLISGEFTVNMDIIIDYKGVSASVSQITSNNLMIFACSARALSNITWRTRIRFTDS